MKRTKIVFSSIIATLLMMFCTIVLPSQKYALNALDSTTQVEENQEANFEEIEYTYYNPKNTEEYVKVILIDDVNCKIKMFDDDREALTTYTIENDVLTILLDGEQCDFSIKEGNIIEDIVYIDDNTTTLVDKINEVLATIENMDAEEMKDYINSLLEKNETYQKLIENEVVKSLFQALINLVCLLGMVFIYFRRMKNSVSSVDSAKVTLNAAKIALDNKQKEIDALKDQLLNAFDQYSKDIKSSKNASEIMTSAFKATSVQLIDITKMLNVLMDEIEKNKNIEETTTTQIEDVKEGE